jgi:hypothetical protein
MGATQAQIAAALAGAAGTVLPRDRRWPNGTGAGRVGTGVPAAVYGDTFGVMPHPAALEQAEWHDPYVITPGFGFAVMSNVANAVTTIGFVWRERKALPGELSV